MSIGMLFYGSAANFPTSYYAAQFFHLCDPIRVKEGQGSDQARGS